MLLGEGLCLIFTHNEKLECFQSLFSEEGHTDVAFYIVIEIFLRSPRGDKKKSEEGQMPPPALKKMAGSSVLS